MRKEAILDFLQAIGVSPPFRVGEQWISCKCPMGWRHSSGEDRHPSLSIKIAETEASGFICFGCGSTGLLHKLLHTLYVAHGSRNLEASHILSQEEIIPTEDAGEPSIDFVDNYLTFQTATSHNWIPIEILDRFHAVKFGSSVTEDYFRFLLEERGISCNVIEKFRVLAWLDQKYVVFPIFSMDGEHLSLLRGRYIFGKRFLELTAEMFEIDCKFPSINETGALFGLEFASVQHPVMVVESELEAMRVVTLGFPNVVATCGPIRAEQMLQLLMFPSWLLGFDADVPGAAYTTKVINAFRGRVPMKVLSWSDVGLSDPGELSSQKQLLHVLAKAKIVAPNGELC